MNRTLVNLFDTYPVEKLLLCVPERYAIEKPPSARWKNRIVTFDDQRFKTLDNALGVFVNPIITASNRALLSHQRPACIEAIEQFEPELILLCTNLLETFICARYISRSLTIPTAVYAMDDWRGHDTAWWGIENGYHLIQSVLKSSAALLSVSDALNETLRSRYHVTQSHTHVVHNPVDMRARTRSTPREHSSAHILYAGSLWGMHVDAVQNIAHAAHLLRNDGMQIDFTILTEERFWKQHEATLSSFGATWGGFLDGEALVSKMEEADALLVASSFRDEFRHLARASVQTKITDYLGAGRPIIAHGPQDAACNVFVEKWKCGYSLTQATPEDLATALRPILMNRDQQDQLGKHAFELAKTHFEKRAVCSELFTFLASILSWSIQHPPLANAHELHRTH